MASAVTLSLVVLLLLACAQALLAMSPLISVPGAADLEVSCMAQILRRAGVGDSHELEMRLATAGVAPRALLTSSRAALRRHGLSNRPHRGLVKRTYRALAAMRAACRNASDDACVVASVCPGSGVCVLANITTAGPVAAVPSYVCHCPRGVQSRGCVHDVECMPDVGICSVRGFCLPSSKDERELKCTLCSTGVTGRLCERRVPLQSCRLPCVNGGRCMQGPTWCKCMFGFTGSRCQTRVSVRGTASTAPPRSSPPRRTEHGPSPGADVDIGNFPDFPSPPVPGDDPAANMAASQAYQSALIAYLAAVTNWTRDAVSAFTNVPGRFPLPASSLSVEEMAQIRIILNLFPVSAPPSPSPPPRSSPPRRTEHGPSPGADAVSAFTNVLGRFPLPASSLSVEAMAQIRNILNLFPVSAPPSPSPPPRSSPPRRTEHGPSPGADFDIGNFPDLPTPPVPGGDPAANMAALQAYQSALIAYLAAVTNWTRDTVSPFTNVLGGFPLPASSPMPSPTGPGLLHVDTDARAVSPGQTPVDGGPGPDWRNLFPIALGNIPIDLTNLPVDLSKLLGDTAGDLWPTPPPSLSPDWEQTPSPSAHHPSPAPVVGAGGFSPELLRSLLASIPAALPAGFDFQAFLASPLEYYADFVKNTTGQDVFGGMRPTAPGQGTAGPGGEGTEFSGFGPFGLALESLAGSLSDEEMAQIRSILNLLQSPGLLEALANGQHP